ncbi:MAG: hypothetical protein QXW98_04650 [Candidatus Caldarchaeum sp.]
MSLGTALNQLIQVLPQLLLMQTIIKLVFNDLLHITVEPAKAKQVTDEDVIESVRRYNTEYGAPASWADVVFDFSPEPLRRMVDRWWNSEEGVKTQTEVTSTLERLTAQGKLRKEGGGYTV